MLSSLPASATQIVVVIEAVLCVLGLGDADLVNLLIGWTGLAPKPTNGTTPESKDSGALEAQKS